MEKKEANNCAVADRTEGFDLTIHSDPVFGEDRNGIF